MELLSNIDRDVLKQAIEYFCTYREVEWKKSEQVGTTEEGKPILTWPFPLYTPESYKYIRILGTDHNYADNYRKYCEYALPTDMNARQIRTMFTMMVRGDRFCDGYFSGFIKDGFVLKCLLRLDDLCNKLEEKE